MIMTERRALVPHSTLFIILDTIPSLMKNLTSQMFSINSYLFLAASQQDQKQIRSSLEALKGISYNSKIYYSLIQNMVLNINIFIFVLM